MESSFLSSQTSCIASNEVALLMRIHFWLDDLVSPLIILVEAYLECKFQRFSGLRISSIGHYMRAITPGRYPHDRGPPVPFDSINIHGLFDMHFPLAAIAERIRPSR